MNANILEQFRLQSGSAFDLRLKRLESALTECGPIGVRCEGGARTDPLPIVIGSETWRMLSVGLAQRARLFDALAADMYGEQRLWKTGVLPASLLKSISAFQMFRRAYSEVTPRNVAEFLLLSEDFPRSLRHCLGQTQDALRKVALPERADSEALRICGM